MYNQKQNIMEKLINLEEIIKANLTQKIWDNRKKLASSKDPFSDAWEMALKLFERIENSPEFSWATEKHDDENEKWYDEYEDIVIEVLNDELDRIVIAGYITSDYNEEIKPGFTLIRGINKNPGALHLGDKYIVKAVGLNGTTKDIFATVHNKETGENETWDMEDTFTSYMDFRRYI